MFLIDENLPRSTVRELQASGYVATDVRDVGLRGKSDADVFAYAVEHDLVLVTGDVGFANPLTYSPQRHLGIVVVPVPNECSTRQVNVEILQGLHDLQDDDIRGAIVVIEPGRTRIRRFPQLSA